MHQCQAQLDWKLGHAASDAARTHSAHAHAHARTHTHTHTYTTHTQVRSDSYPSVAVSDEGDDADEAEANKKLVPVTFEVCFQKTLNPKP